MSATSETSQPAQHKKLNQDGWVNVLERKRMSERMLGNVPEMCPHVTSADVEFDSQSVSAP